MKRFWLNSLFCVLMFHFACVLTVISPLLIRISETYALSMAEAGWVFSLNFFGFVSFVFFGGALADRFGKKPVMLCALLGLSAGLVLIAFASDYAMFCAVMFLVGGFGGVLETVTSAAVPDVNDSHAGFHQNLIHIFFGVGALVGPVSAGMFISSGAFPSVARFFGLTNDDPILFPAFGMDWKFVFLVLGALGLLLAIVLAFVRLPVRQRAAVAGTRTPAETAPASVSIASRIGSIAGDGKFLLVCLCMFLYTGSEVGTWGWLSTFLKSNLGFTIGKASLAVGVFWIAMTVGRIVCGQISLVVPSGRIIAVLAFASSAVTLASPFVDGEAITWIQIALMGLFFSSIWPLTVGYGGEHRGTGSGMEFSALVGSGSIGAMVIPFLMGLVGAAAGTKIPMLIPFVSFLFIALVFTAFNRATPRRGD